MPIQAYKELLAFKIESVVGTPEVLTDSETIKVSELQYNPAIEFQQRAYTDDIFTRYPHAPVGKLATISFTVDLAGSGAAATNPYYANLFLACGMVEAGGVYSFTADPDDYKTVTISCMHEGNIKTISGAMGSWSVEGSNKSFGKLRFTFTGLYQSPTTGSLLATEDEAVPPLCAGGIYKWNNVARVISQFSIDTAISIKPLADMNNATGYYRTWIDGRTITGSFDPEMITGVSMWTDYHTGTERAFSATVGTVAGNKIKFDAAACQLTSLADGTRDGVRIHNAQFAADGTIPLTISYL